MKRYKLIACLLLVCCLLLLPLQPAQAATAEQKAQAEVLKQLGLFLGGSYSFELERSPTRLEALIILIRLVGEEDAALTSTAINPFDDKLGWPDAGRYLAYSYETSITHGLSDTHFGTADRATARQYLTFVLRALGYDDAAGDFSYEQAEVKAAELGLIAAGSYPAGGSFLRGDCVSIAYTALNCCLKDSDQTLYRHLAQLGVVPEEFDLSLALPEQGGEDEDLIYYSKVPILMYHMLGYSKEPNTLYLTPEHFTQHLDYFEQQGIHPVTFAQLLDHWDNKTPLPTKPLVICFDDGYKSMYTEALPRLVDHSMVATFFVFTDFIDAPGGMTSRMVREMVAAGMEIGSHTVSHQQLTALSVDKMQAELADSKSFLEELTGEPCLTLAYPIGMNNQQVRLQTMGQGYRGAVTTIYGLASDSDSRYMLPRIRINQGDNANALAKKLAQYGY